MPVYKHPLFGPVRFTILDGAGGPIQLGDSFEKNIVSVHVPQLTGVPLYKETGTPISGNIQFHKDGIAQLLAAWHEVEQRGLLPLVLSWGGSYNSRLIRDSTTTPSNHAFGTAFDINPDFNGFGAVPPASGRHGSVRELVPIFEKHGFLWGGNFQSKQDGMHFEVARLGVAPLVPAPPAVQVFINGVQKPIPAVLIADHTQIGIRKFTGEFGGKISEIVLKSPCSVKVTANREAKILGVVIEESVYVAFTDVITLYDGISFTFDNGKNRLNLTKVL